MQTHVIEVSLPIRDREMPATLTLPTDPTNVQAGIVYVHGSGDGDQNEVPVEAERFARMGVAFLTVKKVMDGYTRAKRDYSLLAQDAVEAIEWLQNRDELRDRPTGLLGFSEGAWVATVASAARQDVIDFLVLESGAIVTPREQIRYHRAAEARSLPLHRRFFDTLYTEFAVLVCNYSGFDSRTFLERLSQPVYAVWGSNDHTIPIDRAKMLLQRHTPILPQIKIADGEPHYLNPRGDWLINVAEWVVSIHRNKAVEKTRPLM